MGKECVWCLVGVTIVSLTVWKIFKSGKDEVAKDVSELIGNTPMVEISSLSELTGCRILGKLEMANPGGSAKDRVARAIVENAEREGHLRPGHPDCVFEGTSGSTGISLALVCQARGYQAHIVVPDDTSEEKVNLLHQLGAQVHLTRPAGIADSNHYVNVARKLASEHEHGIFADQFETTVNWQAHAKTTGPEIWRQTGHHIDAFVTGAGTGGTITGVASYLKSRTDKIQIILADPPGSGLFNKVRYGVMFNTKEKEGTRRRHQVDTIIEGIGSTRITRNLDHGLPLIDDAFAVSDAEALAMAHYLVQKEGLFVGSSSGVNCVGALRTAQKLGPGHVIVTILCDSGVRHLSKFWKQPVDSEISKKLGLSA